MAIIKNSEDGSKNWPNDSDDYNSIVRVTPIIMTVLKITIVIDL